MYPAPPGLPRSSVGNEVLTGLEDKGQLCIGLREGRPESRTVQSHNDQKGNGPPMWLNGCTQASSGVSWPSCTAGSALHSGGSAPFIYDKTSQDINDRCHATSSLGALSFLKLTRCPQTPEAATVSPGMYGVTKGLGKSPDARLPQPRVRLSQWTSCVTLLQATGSFTTTA